MKQKLFVVFVVVVFNLKTFVVLKQLEIEKKRLLYNLKKIKIKQIQQQQQKCS